MKNINNDSLRKDTLKYKERNRILPKNQVIFGFVYIAKMLHSDRNFFSVCFDIAYKLSLSLPTNPSRNGNIFM